MSAMITQILTGLFGSLVSALHGWFVSKEQESKASKAEAYKAKVESLREAGAAEDKIEDAVKDAEREEAQALTLEAQLAALRAFTGQSKELRQKGPAKPGTTETLQVMTDRILDGFDNRPGVTRERVLAAWGVTARLDDHGRTMSDEESETLWLNGPANEQLKVNLEAPALATYLEMFDTKKDALDSMILHFVVVDLIKLGYRPLPIKVLQTGDIRAA